MTETREQVFVAKSTVRAIARAEIQKFADDVLAQAIGQSIAKMVHEAEARFAAKLEDAVKEFAFKGQWHEGAHYRRGNFVSMGGQVYHCNADTTSRPGTYSAWTLAVRSGRDGRDGKDAVPPEPPTQGTTRPHR